LAGRIVSSSMHGAFFGVGSVVAAGLVAKEKQSRAIALMFSGLALSNIIGVPLGTALGQAMGWRATFFGVSVLGLVAGSFLFVVLKPQAADSSGSIANEVSALARPRVWLALGTTTFGFGGVFVVWTYIAPILGSATGLSPEWITGVLFIFGIGLTLGNHFIGQWADKSVSLALIGVLAALILLLALFSVTMNSFIPATITIFLWASRLSVQSRLCRWGLWKPPKARLIWLPL